ncbi:hypothetical protein M409DRAFT_21534 [Zasmidium cellare ATCC 36951]|uniref:Uncharacterized protein n=1 Tax=Zasmidium cellare ATCC 36951 TaxID=1080233 RepID=A0A6A6CQN9_ZASCE|nr:uncharacterized protein M409DRAFT_21534 [Zasmidium cellare ATCC 36951]KAF2168089.1 hypothetical protein M409DRAFT_21534 [Zasmidium cellare ATCC 36951]
MTSQGVKVLDPEALGPKPPIYSAMTAVPLSPHTTQYYISGQTGVDPTTNELPPDLESQLDNVLKRLSICLDYIGAKKTDLATFHYYFRQPAVEDLDGRELEGARKVVHSKVSPWLEGHRPASCYSRTFGMSHPKFLCEISATAVVYKP